MSGNSQSRKMTPSKENYLKVMLELSSQEGIRSVDIAKTLGVSKASVSSMMNVLRNEGYIHKEKYGVVVLTEDGENVAVNIKRRYEMLKRYLHNVLGVEAGIAAEDACRIEHLISSETLQRIDQQLEELSEYQCRMKLL